MRQTRTHTHTHPRDPLHSEERVPCTFFRTLGPVVHRQQRRHDANDVVAVALCNMNELLTREHACILKKIALQNYQQVVNRKAHIHTHQMEIVTENVPGEFTRYKPPNTEDVDADTD